MKECARLSRIETIDDVRLVLWLRAKAKGDASLLARIDEIVKKATDAGRDALLSLAAEAR